MNPACPEVAEGQGSSSAFSLARCEIKTLPPSYPQWGRHSCLPTEISKRRFLGQLARGRSRRERSRRAALTLLGRLPRMAATGS